MDKFTHGCTNNGFAIFGEPTYLHIQHQQPLLDRNGTTIAQLPIEDLGVVILQLTAIDILR